VLKVKTKKTRSNAELKQKLGSLSKYSVSAGIFATAGKHPGSKDGSTYAEIARINEFGTEKIPERPAFRSSFKANRRLYRKTIRNVAEDVFKWWGGGRVDAKKIMAKLGNRAVNDIEKSIVGGSWAANAESTMLKKGKGQQLINRPLIDTGKTLEKIEWKFRKYKG
tara:strand:+ start:78 stop:575 length:498 start_codon:yes stop_codon:yes gene_type:complete